MVQVNELERLEGFVSRLLAKHKSLREKSEKLTEELRARDELISNLRRDLSKADSERAEVNQRINQLVDRIEQWEREIMATEVRSIKTDNNSGVQGSLFSLESDKTIAEE